MTMQLREIPHGLRFGEPIAYQRLRITPLYSSLQSGLEYLLFDDSVAGKLVEVVEVSRAGSVPELLVRNRAKMYLFLPDGSTLIGSKQNRVVNVSILLAPQSETVIPVSCVERGRWSFVVPSSSPSEHVDKELRRAMCADANAGIERDGKVQVSQSGVWCHVDKMLKGSGALSPSQAYHAVHEKWNHDLAEYQQRVPWPEKSVGVAVEVDGQVETIELFDKPDTLRRLWPRLIRSYAVGAMANPTAAQSPGTTDIAAFLSQALHTDAVKSARLGAGTSMRLSCQDSVGAALVYEDQLVHLSLFANRNHSQSTVANETRPPNETRPNQQPEQPPHDRPWWRFWM